MVFGWFRPRFDDATHALYGAIVAQARQPGFYVGHRVPDTVEGRFEMVLLHVALVADRLGRADEAARPQAQQLLDLFFLDMDRTLREMGVGDLSVPKKMKKIGGAYAGRSDVYRAALEAGDTAALEGALGRNVYGERPDPAGTPALARYARDAHAALAACVPADILAARLPWPDPAATAPTEPQSTRP